MSKIVLFLIKLYQKYLSFDTGLGRFLVFGRPVCRHFPTCSQYTYQMVEKRGVIRGLALGGKRILGCSHLENFKFKILN